MKIKTEVKAKPEHTPTPWKIEEDQENGDRVIVNEDGMIVCRRPNEENAKFIVHAVNSHDELLRLLKAMTDQIDKHFYKLPEDNENDGKYWKRLYDSACELITQVEGK